MREELLAQLDELYKKELSIGPFPLSQARKVGEGKDWLDFHACLTHFLNNIAGIASHGKRLNRITSERRLEFQRLSAQPFFIKYPQFREIEQRIQSSDVPDLKQLMEATEKARLLIVGALSD